MIAVESYLPISGLSVICGMSAVFSGYSGFIMVFTVFRLLTDFVCLYTYEF